MIARKQIAAKLDASGQLMGYDPNGYYRVFHLGISIFQRVAISLFFIFLTYFSVSPCATGALPASAVRSNGMSIALLVNRSVSTTIAATSLPTVGKFGYSTMFFVFAGCPVIYFITAAFFLPEAKGKTLEEIEEHFEGKKS